MEMHGTVQQHKLNSVSSLSPCNSADAAEHYQRAGLHQAPAQLYCVQQQHVHNNGTNVEPHYSKKTLQATACQVFAGLKHCNSMLR
jgi:hypothetical protein